MDQAALHFHLLVGHLLQTSAVDVAEQLWKNSGVSHKKDLLGSELQIKFYKQFMTAMLQRCLMKVHVQQ